MNQVICTYCGQQVKSQGDLRVIFTGRPLLSPLHDQCMADAPKLKLGFGPNSILLPSVNGETGVYWVIASLVLLPFAFAATISPIGWLFVLLAMVPAALRGMSWLQYEGVLPPSPGDQNTAQQRPAVETDPTLWPWDNHNLGDESREQRRKLALENIIQELSGIPGLQGILLVGPMAKHKEYLGNILDLLIVADCPPQELASQYHFKLSLHWQDTQTFTACQGKRTRSLPLSSFAQILWDPTGLIAQNLAQAKDLAELGPLPLDAPQALALAEDVARGMEYIQGLFASRWLTDTYLATSSYILKCLDLIYDHRGWWWPEDEIIRDLEDRDVPLASLVLRALSSPDWSRRQEALAELSLTALEAGSAGEVKGW